MASAAGTPVMTSAAWFQTHDPVVAIDGDDPVGDVREDGDALFALQGDATVELGIGERDGDACGQRSQRLALLISPGAWTACVHREDAVDGALAAGNGDREEGTVAGREDRVGDAVRHVVVLQSLSGVEDVPAGQPAGGATAPLAAAAPPPVAAEMTSPEPDSRVRAEASASSSAAASVTTASVTATGSSSCTSREPARASR